MACASAGCGGGGGGGCHKEDEDDRDASPCKPTPASNLCFKCKIEKAFQGKNNNLCEGCFRINLFGKFKQSITTQDMISPTDNLLIAFSGGPSSRVALQFVHELQYKAQMNSDASRDKSYPVFGVGVAFIDERAVASIPSHEFDEAIQDMRSIVSSLAPPVKQLHVVTIENILSSRSKDGRHQLEELVHTITDITGKEDFLQHLRMLSLQKIALDNKYNKLVLGSCTSRIACSVITATVKGLGYSLPADIQYVDARWEIPVVLPLRDCLAQELATLCHLDSLKTLDLLDGSRSGINGLVSTFIALLQEENPAREPTIVRTAEKLLPFHFNRLLETNDSSDHLPRWRRKKPNLKLDESISSEFLCPICSSPLNRSDLDCLEREVEKCETSLQLFGASCCPSCQFQILPKDFSSMEQFYSLLPPQMTAKAKERVGSDQTWLRAHIEDCLLSDGEDET